MNTTEAELFSDSMEFLAGALLEDARNKINCMKEINNSIEEDYCSFEICKILKEKGFDIITLSGYNLKTQESLTSFPTRNSDQIALSRPTHALAIKWIRENFNIHIWVEHKLGHFKPWVWFYNKSQNTEPWDFRATYEEAIEAALIFVLTKLTNKD